MNAMMPHISSKGVSIYDVRAESEEGGSRNAANLRTNSVHFAHREGGGDQKHQNYVAVIYGSSQGGRELEGSE